MLWRIFEVKYLQYIAFKIVPAKSMLRVDSLLLFPCGMMNAVAHTKPTSEELRNEVEELRSTAARLQEQASRLVERCAVLEDLISRGSSKANQFMADRVPHVHRVLRMVRTERTMMGALDRIGCEQLSPNKPVICLQYSRISPA